MNSRLPFLWVLSVLGVRAATAADNFTVAAYLPEWRYEGANFADMQAMQMQMQMGMGQQVNAQFDAKKEYAGERDAMRVFRHRWRPAAVERNLVGMAPVLDDE